MPGYLLRLFGVAGFLLFGAPLALPLVALKNVWPGLVQDIFNNRPMNDGNDVIAIEMPTRAEDAAIVPVTLRTKLLPGDIRQVLSITLVIDENPAPMAAKFQLGPDAKVSEISTRVRVNNYTDVHAVAELSDGKLYMTKTYVKASGGCSAPAAKNADEAKGRLGQMRYRQFGWTCFSPGIPQHLRADMVDCNDLRQIPVQSGLAGQAFQSRGGAKCKKPEAANENIHSRRSSKKDALSLDLSGRSNRNRSDD